MRHHLAIDMGGTYLRSQLYNETQCFAVMESRERNLHRFLDVQLHNDPQIASVSIAYAGQVNGGKIVAAPNIAFEESDICGWVERQYGIECFIDNDLSCAALAEAAYWEVDSVAVLYAGTGLGASVIDGGKLIRGDRNMAYEIGHIPYRASPWRCGCGRDNCIELYASGSGIQKQLEAMGSSEHPDLKRLSRSALSSERAIAEEFEAAFFHAAGVLVTLANPALLVIGGGIVQHNPDLLERLRDNIAHFALNVSLQDLRIERSALEHAPLEGAKLLKEHLHG